MDAIDRLNAALEGRYRIERQLGQGGMATVYLAADLRHERKVALSSRRSVGIEPVWSRSGDELYYRREGELMVASMQRSGAALTVGAARRVMADEYVRQTAGGAGGMANYDILPDGSGFVMIEDASRDATEPSRYFLVQNWFERLKALVPN